MAYSISKWSITLTVSPGTQRTALRVTFKYLNNYLVYHNFVNFAKKGHQRVKEVVLLNFIRNTYAQAEQLIYLLDQLFLYILSHTSPLGTEVTVPSWPILKAIEILINVVFSISSHTYDFFNAILPLIRDCSWEFSQKYN